MAIDAMSPECDAWAYLDRLRDAIGVVDYSVGMERLFEDGKLELCFRALPNVLGFRAAGVPIDWTVPDEGTTDTLDALWIPRGIPEPKIELAMRYINTALQPRTQQDWCAQLGTLPVHPDSEAPDILRRNGLPESVDDLTGILPIPESVKASHESEWEARFRASLESPAAPGQLSSASPKYASGHVSE